MTEPKGHFVDIGSLPILFPTHIHDPRFWEALGRVVATFGFLEQTLCKAIFSFTATKPYSEEEMIRAYDEWLPKLQRALTDQLWNLIESYGKAVREHPKAASEDLDDLLNKMKAAAKIRNVICHGSWRIPNQDGASTPFFVNRQYERFDSAIDVNYLLQLQRHVAELVCDVVSSVTLMGWQFPGSGGPGEVIWEKGA